MLQVQGQVDQNYQGYEDYPGNDGYEDEEYEGYQEDEIETLYLYTFDPEKPSWNKGQIIACIELVLLALAIVSICLIPNTPAYTITTISVPAQFHTQSFKADSAIIATGKHQYPAIRAQGVLTIYNGSFLRQSLPSGFIVSASNGQEFATDYAVTIEAGNPPNYGVASVSAHALVAGTSGNIEAGAINAVYGSSLYIKNLAAFSGGQDASTQTYVTSEDQATALEAARQQIAIKTPIGLLAQPCTEAIKQEPRNLTVTLTCQFVTYQLPRSLQASQVLSVHVQSNQVVLTLKFVARPPIHFAK